QNISNNEMHSATPNISSLNSSPLSAPSTIPMDYGSISSTILLSPTTTTDGNQLLSSQQKFQYPSQKHHSRHVLPPITDHGDQLEQGHEHEYGYEYEQAQEQEQVLEQNVQDQHQYIEKGYGYESKYNHEPIYE